MITNMEREGGTKVDPETMPETMKEFSVGIEYRLQLPENEDEKMRPERFEAQKKSVRSRPRMSR